MSGEVKSETSRPDWYAPLREIKSLGSQASKASSLAGLHEARQVHLGQFFTPSEVAHVMYRLIQPYLDCLPETERASILDNSVGSGRLLQYCDPKRHIVGGVDVHGPSIKAVQDVFEKAGFESLFENGSMADLKVSGWSAAVINPPFSLTLSSPHMKQYGCTAYGKFGPHTSAQSDYYAVAQACEAASVVVALVPRTVAAEIWDDPTLVQPLGQSRTESRLKARFDLPGNTFAEEGANVTVSLLVFDAYPVPVAATRHIVVKTLDDVVLDRPTRRLPVRTPKLSIRTTRKSKPSITLPVTGDRSALVRRSGRHLRIRFKCGLVQAKVMNGLLVKQIFSTEKHRLPMGYSYSGQGQLDIEVHLLQEDPIASIKQLLERIRDLGGDPQVGPEFWPYLHKRLRRHIRAATPMAQTVWREEGATTLITAKCKKNYLVRPSEWSSPIICKGDVLQFHRDQGMFRSSVCGESVQFGYEELQQYFEEIDGVGEGAWVPLRPGVMAADPMTALWWRRRLAASPVRRWLSWRFQQDDLIELLMAPRGACAAWTMGLGKSRLGLALILLSGVKHGLFTTDAYLIPEMVEQIEKLGLPKGTWKVIRTPADLDELATVNLISIERLRGDLYHAPKGSVLKRNRTYAMALRRRVGICVSDEGDFLANPNSAQSKALNQLSARRRYLLTGTPIGNMPRDALPMLCYVAGDSVAAQPWGYRGAFLEPRFINSVEFADRGIDRFMAEFITVEWCTNLYADTLVEGAKREIPQIKNLDAYRAMLAPHVKRRVTDEPEVAAVVRIPKPTVITTWLEWNDDHLAHYLRVAEDFHEWMQGSGQCGLVTILLKFNAVLRALNFPQAPAKHVKDAFSGITSKQTWAVDRLAELAESGKKVLCFAQSPELVKLLARQLYAQHEVPALALHGGMSVAQRHRLLREKFKTGQIPVAIATKGVVRGGLNLPQADWIVMFDRSWTAREEQQCIARALRPETDHEVTVEYAMLEGSADAYQAQAVAFKAECQSSGLDWGTPELRSSDFQHLETILGKFCDDLALIRGTTSLALRKKLKELA